MKIKIILFFVIVLAIACQNTNKEETKSVKEAIEAEVTIAHAQKIELKIEGMTCAGCENAIQKTIDNFDGVYSSKADHVKGIATFEMDSTKVDISKVEEAIHELGYEPKGYTKLSD